MVFIVCIFHNKIDNLKAKLQIMFSEFDHASTENRPKIRL